MYLFNTAVYFHCTSNVYLARLLWGGANNKELQVCILIRFLKTRPEKQSETINGTQLESSGVLVSVQTRPHYMEKQKEKPENENLIVLFVSSSQPVFYQIHYIPCHTFLSQKL